MGSAGSGYRKKRMHSVGGKAQLSRHYVYSVCVQVQASNEHKAEYKNTLLP